MAKLPLSVAIISFNEEANLPRTLKSVADIASEIIIVDSHSTDRTVEIAKEFGAKVYIEDWKGHIAQKNSALEKCSEPWILALDCDEVLTDELRHSVTGAVISGAADGYVLNRRTFYAGKFLRFSWQPDRKLRLVKRTAKPEWGGYNPHDVLSISGTEGKLKGDLHHFSFKDVSDHFQRTVSYAKIAADSYHKRGKRFSLFRLLFNPPAAFVKKYFFRLGFLDGFRGFIAAFSSFVSVAMKYIFLWEIEKTVKKDSDS